MAETTSPGTPGIPGTPGTTATTSPSISASSAVDAGAATPGTPGAAPEVGKLVQEAVATALAQQSKAIKAEAEKLAADARVSAARDKFLAEKAPKLPGVYADRFIPKTDDPAALAAGIQAAVQQWTADRKASGDLPSVSGDSGNTNAVNLMEAGEIAERARAYRSGNPGIDAIAQHISSGAYRPRPQPPA